MNEETVHRRHLRGDCQSCFGLCCAALPFAFSADFAADKEAGRPCPNLEPDFRCGIHSTLRTQGYRGCTVFDCFGAGQAVSLGTFEGRDWRQHPENAQPMFEVFPIMRQLYELLYYLTEVLTMRQAHSLHEAAAEAIDETERLTRLGPDSLIALDVAAHRDSINSLLLKASELVREEALRKWKLPSSRMNKYGRGSDLIGAKLRGADLRGANLRGAWLIAADLRGADLRSADLIGADFRDADVRGADLTGSLFLTQPQLNAAQGDAGTKLPPSLERPSHWSA